MREVSSGEKRIPFLFAEELADVPGISMQMVEQWADLITLDPEF